tara:strand:+ start:131 stop:610 length:480 start_codon:yes stop_codon:yes gene_type:complete
MSILTRINGIPVYTSITEALEWGKYNRIKGYHIHKYKSVTGYMGGNNHMTMPSRTRDLPVKLKSKPGYRPEIGSSIIYIESGIKYTATATASTIYGKTGFPISGSRKITNQTPIIAPVLVPEAPAPVVPIPSAPIPLAAPAQSSSAGSSSYSGGGGGGY